MKREIYRKAMQDPSKWLDPNFESRKEKPW